MIWLKTDRVVLNSLLQKKHHIGARLPVFLRCPGASEKPVNGRLIASCACSPGPKICNHSTILQEIAPYIRDTVSTSFTFLLCQSLRTPRGEPCWQSVCWGCVQKAAACADDPCEAALALVGVCDKVMVWDTMHCQVPMLRSVHRKTVTSEGREKRSSENGPGDRREAWHSYLRPCE